MKQAGVGHCNLPGVYDFKHLIVFIDYFSKSSEAKATKSRTLTFQNNLFYLLQ